MPRIDYDAIADVYDDPSRDHVADANLLAFLDERGSASGLRVLDVGCGTGKQIAADRERLPDVHLIGVDRFHAMLRRAQARCPSAGWIQADGAALPLAAGSVDYATSQFSYPHVRATGELLGELFRVLRSGGRFVMTNIDPWSMPGWLVYRYFPEAQALDHQDFVPVERFLALMAEAGFVRVRASRVDLSRDEPLDRFHAYVSDRRRASQLMAIPDAAYARGVHRVEAAAATGVAERSEFVLVTVIGDKPRP